MATLGLKPFATIGESVEEACLGIDATRVIEPHQAIDVVSDL